MPWATLRSVPANSLNGHPNTTWEAAARGAATKNTPPDKITPELAQQVEQTIDLMKHLGGKCSQWGKRLVEGRVWTVRVAEHRLAEPAA